MIYFIHAPELDRVKIGFTDGTAESRLKTLQTGSPVELVLLGSIEGDMAAENALHLRFASDHIRLEWFQMSSDLQGFIEEVTGSSVQEVEVAAVRDGQAVLRSMSMEELRIVEETLRGKAIVENIANNDFWVRQIKRHFDSLGAA